MRTDTEHRKKHWLAGLGCLAMALVFFPCCSSYNLQKKLTPEHADFLSKVRYIISGREQKAFLRLPDSEKDQFIANFWKSRDLDPYTEENEFKAEYFKRIDQANRLFLGEGRPGWLTDRGRIYILFGPPMQRLTNPLSSDLQGRCGEIWYYGGFPVLFRDSNCIGRYDLVTYDLTPLREVNLAYMHDLSQAQADAQAEAQRTFSPAAALLDFSFEVKKETAEPERIAGAVEITIPYSRIWLTMKEGILETEMEVRLELRDEAGRLRWEDQKSFKVSLKETEMREKQMTSYNLEIPFDLEKDLEVLRGGKNTFLCHLKNLTGGEELRKTKEIVF
jgi:GWxTD domain-containing protein